ncbi:MAG: transcription antitermination factor NusB [Solobacterium sp.]|nr:transcription antitermination factor NusB [Solobacterium sp.]
MTRHENREKAMIATYQNQIFNRPVEELIADNFTDEEVDDYIISVVRQAIEQTDRYHTYIDEVLDDWSFDRLGMIEQAILLNGCAEFDLKQIEAAVIIDEYVRLAKKFCDSDSYKLINGVLDRI